MKGWIDGLLAAERVRGDGRRPLVRRVRGPATWACMAGSWAGAAWIPVSEARGTAVHPAIGLLMAAAVSSGVLVGGQRRGRRARSG